VDRSKAKAVAFLKGKEMDCDDMDMDDCVEVFMEEMERGLEGGRSSLRMIPTFIDVEREIPIGRPIVVLDAGGTNFRVAVVSFRSEGPPSIERFSLHAMPGLGGEVSKSEFFETVTEFMREALEGPKPGTVASIGFCFSYPTEILPNKDGRLIRFSKEVKAREVEGELIGENLLAFLKQRGFGGFVRRSLPGGQDPRGGFSTVTSVSYSARVRTAATSKKTPTSERDGTSILRGNRSSTSSPAGSRRVRAVSSMPSSTGPRWTRGSTPSKR
jgi:hypothetical protein